MRTSAIFSGQFIKDGYTEFGSHRVDSIQEDKPVFLNSLVGYWLNKDKIVCSSTPLFTRIWMYRDPCAVDAERWQRAAGGSEFDMATSINLLHDKLRIK
jgi:hypothetical protein